MKRNIQTHEQIFEVVSRLSFHGIYNIISLLTTIMQCKFYYVPTLIKLPCKSNNTIYTLFNCSFLLIICTLCVNNLSRISASLLSISHDLTFFFTLTWIRSLHTQKKKLVMCQLLSLELSSNCPSDSYSSMG